MNMRKHSFIKSILVLSVFTVFYFTGNVFAGYNTPENPFPPPPPSVECASGCTVTHIVDTYCPGNTCATEITGEAVTNTGNQTVSGFYHSDITGLDYPIGASGPSNTGGGGGCNSTGVYASCAPITSCSPTCGPGTQTQRCYDTGCGTIRDTTISCMINDPTIWGTPTTYSVLEKFQRAIFLVRVNLFESNNKHNFNNTCNHRRTSNPSVILYNYLLYIFFLNMRDAIF
ncbi:MAG: hypothetical protein MUO77_02025 [Anaerolineales bacterium]|nr:hypothetical protein [Anaerolineales bacterium]